MLNSQKRFLNMLSIIFNIRSILLAVFGIFLGSLITPAQAMVNALLVQEYKNIFL
jgi:nitrate reductase gamma subunit